MLGGTVYRTEAALHYLKTANLSIQRILTPYVIASIGTEYEGMRTSFLAASLDLEEEMSHGLFTGQAIVYNEVIHQHVDSEDAGVCVTFCAGRFDGGYMYFPDLDMGFRYVGENPLSTGSENPAQIQTRGGDGLPFLGSLPWSHPMDAENGD